MSDLNIAVLIYIVVSIGFTAGFLFATALLIILSVKIDRKSKQVDKLIAPIIKRFE